MSQTSKAFKLKLFTPRGGIKVPHSKHTNDCETQFMPPPQRVVIPMQQHIGAPCKPTVSVGDVVKIGQLIGDSDAFVSAPIHASISGKVKAIRKVVLPATPTVDAVEIESDGKMEYLETLEPPKVDNVADLIAAVRASGLVGLGGAGFPTHVKLRTSPDKPIDTLIINCAECEPFVTSDYRECLENTWDIFTGIYTIKDILGISNVFIAIENNKPAAIRELREIAENEKYNPQHHVNLAVLKSNYPQGAEKVMVYAVTGRKIPAGKLPADVGVMLMNITSVAFLSRYLKTGIPLVNKRVTVDGSAVQNPSNVWVPIGTSIQDVIAFTGGYKTEPRKILMGGPMMGLSIYDDTLPVLKQNNAILAFDEKDATLLEPSACIRCGRCVEVCPMGLMPVEIAREYGRQNWDVLKKLHVDTCIECGCCSFSCPAKRVLVQSIRLAKAQLREMEKREVK